MKCKCSVFIIDKTKYFVQCEKCKNGTDINYELFDNNEYLKKFKWYEQHTLMIRDNPNLRLGLNLFCLYGYGMIFILCYLQYFEIINYQKIIILDIGFKILVPIYICILFGYIDGISKLSSDSKYKLYKNNFVQ